MAKRALCIGINDYPGTDSDLAGCVNDAQDWAAALAARGFGSPKLMLDKAATLAAMRAEFMGLVEGSQPGDQVVITFSGHGTWQPDDDDGEEPDFRDEALCPWDCVSNGVLLDDELLEIFGQRKAGVRVVLISDSCHSGSVARMAPAPADGGRGRIRFLPPEVLLQREPQKLARARRVERAPALGRPRTGALLLAGCRDTEYSYDASFGGRPNGAFTHVALQALAELPAGADYRQWIAAVRLKLPSAAYPQTPQLFGTSSQKRWDVPA